jgi:hypothetical protein
MNLRRNVALAVLGLEPLSVFQPVLLAFSPWYLLVW